MVTIGVALVCAVLVALLAKWLEKPVWHTCRDTHEFENYIYHLVAPDFPWPVMHVNAGVDEQLTLSRVRSERGGFDLELTIFTSSDSAPSVAEALGGIECGVTEQFAESGLSSKARFGQATSASITEVRRAIEALREAFGKDPARIIRICYSGEIDEVAARPILERGRADSGPVGNFATRVALRRLKQRRQSEDSKKDR